LQKSLIAKAEGFLGLFAQTTIQKKIMCKKIKVDFVSLEDFFFKQPFNGFFSHVRWTYDLALPEEVLLFGSQIQKTRLQKNLALAKSNKSQIRPRIEEGRLKNSVEINRVSQ